MVVLVPTTINVSQRIVLTVDARDLNLVTFVINMQIVMQGSTANKNLHGRLHLNVTRLIPISSNALILINVALLLIAGMCPRLIDELMLKSAFHSILKKREQLWDGSQTIL